MSAYGLSRLEHSCIQPGLWLIEGHQVRRLGNRSRGPWIVIRLNGGGVPGPDGLEQSTFEAAVATIADHVDKGCDCP